MRGVAFRMSAICAITLALGCGKTVANTLPELPAGDVSRSPDVPKPVLPPEVCVGLLPEEDKWLPVLSEADSAYAEDELRAEGADDTQDTGMIEDTDGGGSVLDVIEEIVTVDASADVLPIPPFAPVPEADVSVDEGESQSELSTSPELSIDVCEIAPASCPGAAMPEWELYDFQPRSCGYKATYGLSLYKNHVTVVALLAAW